MPMHTMSHGFAEAAETRIANKNKNKMKQNKWKNRMVIWRRVQSEQLNTPPCEKFGSMRFGVVSPLEFLTAALAQDARKAAPSTDLAYRFNGADSFQCDDMIRAVFPLGEC